MVSVWMITYNHEKYVKHALDSVLFQDINFNIEIVIGDDNSTDNTKNIILEYKNKYPKIIKPHFNEENKGMMANMIETLNRCKGKYIALLEGDDYWTDNKKLKQQIKILDQNRSISFCFHNALIVYENSNKIPHPFTNIKKGLYSGDQILNEWIVPTASVVFPNQKIDWPDFSYELVHGDIFLFLLLLEKGPAFFIDKQLSAYRKNDNSITNVNKLNPSYISKIIKQLRHTNRYFNYKYDKIIKDKLIYWQLAHLNALESNKLYLSFVKYFIYYFIKDPIFYLKKIKAKI